MTWKLIFAAPQPADSDYLQIVEAPEPESAPRKPVSMTVQLDPVVEGDDDDD